MDINVYIKNQKVDVKATYNTETKEVVVKKGSKILNFYQRECKDSLAKSYIKKVEEIKKDGTIIQEDVFAKDYTFSSLSAAASVVQGNNRNGRETFLIENTNSAVGSILDNETDLIEYIYDHLDEYEEIEQEAKEQTEQFQEKYPLEDLKNLTLEEYDRNGNSNSFMNMIENRTNAYASGNLNSNYNKIFAHLGEENYYVKNKILDNVENMNLTEKEMFKKYITKCYEYIKNFNKETYNSIDDYPGKEYLDGSNVIKMKLILNYLGPIMMR